MRQVNEFTLYERVTSDTHGDVPAFTALHLTGRAFLAQEPYGGGRATLAAVVARRRGQVTLEVGFPAERAQAELTLDEHGRILRETLTAPNHLITRTFVYPGSDHDEPG